MFTTIIGFLGSSVFGSILGVFGNWLNQRTILKAEKVKNEQEVMMARIQIEMVTAKTDASIKITKAQVEGAVDLQDSKSYAANLVVANQKSFSDKWIDKLFEVDGWLKYIATPIAVFTMASLAFVDVIKGFMRPVLTIGFTTGFGYLTYISYFILKQKGFEVLTTAQAILYFTLALNTCIMLTTTCVTWWFADRRAAKSINRMNERRLKMNELITGVEEPPTSENSKPPVLGDEVTPTDEEE